MDTKNDKKYNEIYEVEYREIHLDEQGNEYYKSPVTKALPLKIFLPIYIIILIILALIGLQISIFVSCAIVVIGIFCIDLVKKGLIKQLLKTDKYYDNSHWDNKNQKQ